MTTYHINPQTGNANKCSTTPDRCRFNSTSEHYADKQSSSKAYEDRMKDYTFGVGSSLAIPPKLAPYEKEVIELLGEGPFGFSDGKYEDCGEAAAAWLVVLEEKGYDVKLVSETKHNSHAWLIVNGEVFDPTPYLNTTDFPLNEGVIHEVESTLWPSLEVSRYRKKVKTITPRSPKDEING